MKNIVFDLGGVLVARNKAKCSPELPEFFSFVRDVPMPYFWEQYDRGVLTKDEVIGELCRRNGCSRDYAERMFREAIDRQEPIDDTAELLADLKRADYRLYVLSNMAHEYIACLRKFDFYALFDGEVVSCEEGMVKPEPQIYELLLSRYNLDPAQTLFIDDRAANVVVAEALGISTHHFNHCDPKASCDELRAQLLEAVVG